MGTPYLGVLLGEARGRQMEGRLLFLCLIKQAMIEQFHGLAGLRRGGDCDGRANSEQAREGHEAGEPLL